MSYTKAGRFPSSRLAYDRARFPGVVRNGNLRARSHPTNLLFVFNKDRSLNSFAMLRKKCMLAVS